ncbi:pentapeptide repeat-containing protein [Streptomyces sp. NPDC101221]|uniref:pentapeptide repeat-containing protein n=1 Tax=Streptomyces sp. NPDC101221 TaxID=3366132 RepID=UPI00382D2F1F
MPCSCSRGWCGGGCGLAHRKRGRKGGRGTDADLQGAVVPGADLQGADLQGAVVPGAVTASTAVRAPR